MVGNVIQLNCRLCVGKGDKTLYDEINPIMLGGYRDVQLLPNAVADAKLRKIFWSYPRIRATLYLISCTHIQKGISTHFKLPSLRPTTQISKWFRNSNRQQEKRERNHFCIIWSHKIIFFVSLPTLSSQQLKVAVAQFTTYSGFS